MNLPCDCCAHAIRKDGKYHCETRGFDIPNVDEAPAICDFYSRKACD